MKIKEILTAIILSLCIASAVAASNKDKQPVLPPECSQLQVDNSAMTLHTYAIGVQIYRWSGVSWDLVAPDAKLFSDEGYNGQVAKHYAGPTWESNSGSRVIGRRVKDCTPNSDAIPWLLLEAVTSDGPGMFRNVIFIQRINTTGGLKPSTPGSEPGEVRRVPYTAEYCFYGKEIE